MSIREAGFSSKIFTQRKIQGQVILHVNSLNYLKKNTYQS